MLPILTQSFWRDEAFSVLLSQNSPLNIIVLTAKDQSPPLYPLLLHYWMLFYGTSEVAVRTLSFIFHVGTATIIFFLARKLLHSYIPAILTAIAVLLNPFLLQYAFEARMYSLLAFLTALGIYCIVVRKYRLAGVSLALTILCHNFGIFIVAAVGVWWVYTNRHVLKQHIFQGLDLFLFPAIALLAWGTVIWNQWERVGSGFWIKQATSAIFLNTLKIYTAGDISYPTASLLQLISFILFICAMSYWLWQKEVPNGTSKKNISLLLGFVALLPLCITYVISALFIPIYHERYLIASLPMLILLAGYALYNVFLENPNRRIFLIVLTSCYMILLAQASEQILSMQTKAAINWGVRQVISLAQPGDVIIPKDVLNFLETKFYAQKNSKGIPVFAYSPTGKIPFYIGSILFEPNEIITHMPKHKRIWEIEPDGGYKLLNLKMNYHST